MNTVLIIFLVLVILFVIFYVLQVFNPSYMIRDSVPLNVRSAVSTKLIDNPGSVRYYYEGWFYIDGNQPIQTANVLFDKGNEFIVALVGSTLNLYVNSSKDIDANGILGSPPDAPLISIPNFPFQKWVFLAINVDGNVVDLYIDGKFVKTAKHTTFINTTGKQINYGNQYTLGRLARFKRVAGSINPQGVWADYMLGNGQGYSISNYHVNAQVRKNNEVTVDQRLI